MRNKPEGWLDAAIILFGWIALFVATVVLLIVVSTKVPEATEPFFINEEPIPLEDQIEHDLEVKYGEWIAAKAVVMGESGWDVKEATKEVILARTVPFFTEIEKWIIARVVMSEASTESFDVKVAVAEVVINRIFSDYREFKLQTAVDEVVYKPLQFSTAQDPTDECYEAVETAIRENRYPDDMLWVRKDYVEYGYEYTVEEGSVLKFSTVTNYNEKTAHE